MKQFNFRIIPSLDLTSGIYMKVYGFRSASGYMLQAADHLRVDDDPRPAHFIAAAAFAWPLFSTNSTAHYP